MSNVVFWFRQDLRLEDNPGLVEATKTGKLLPVYILDTANCDEYSMGGASRVWLHHSLDKLNVSLENKLLILEGDPLKLIPKLIEKNKITDIFWNRMYEPWAIIRDKALKQSLTSRGINVASFNGSLLWEPWSVTKTDGTPYRVFTPFYRKGCLNSESPRAPLSRPGSITYANHENKTSLANLNLLPKKKWDRALIKHWNIGESGAHERLELFLENGISNYKDGRNLPAKPYVSSLSPHLRFGEISPNQVWSSARQLSEDKHVDHFCSELGWREFSYNLLFNNPELPKKNLQQKFDKFPWVTDKTNLNAWRRGQTGFPFVDAGMRQLWSTGTMHNRVRMVVGSFLVKNLLLDWRHGERWFWDCLFDADLANNSASWQWVAGCGADAAPYFRIFNPIGQGQKFDTDGEYTRHFIPELANLPSKFLFNPWEAPKKVLKDANVKLGVNYPTPIVDIRASRARALMAFDSLK